jgi:hypothetical protein
MIIWMVMAIGLIVIVAGGFVTRNRYSRTAGQATHDGTHAASHHGKGSRRSRGRGRGH